MEPEIVLLRAAALLLGVPAFLLGVFWMLDRLESWVLKPDERAAEVHTLLTQVERAEDVEEAVARLLAPVDSEMTTARGLLARARARAWFTRAGPLRSSNGATAARSAEPDVPRSLRRQEALAEAQEALLEASAVASEGDDQQSHPSADVRRSTGG